MRAMVGQPVLGCSMVLLKELDINQNDNLDSITQTHKVIIMTTETKLPETGFFSIWASYSISKLHFLLCPNYWLICHF